MTTSQLGDYLGAEFSLKRALAIREQILEADHPNIAASLNNLAGMYYVQGKYNMAEPLFRRALELRKKI